MSKIEPQTYDKNNERNYPEKIYDESRDILQPKNDVVFQALFTRGKESITKAMLEDILKIKIDKLELDNSKDLLNDNSNDKNGRLDLRAIINGNVECDIEIQLEPHEKMIERFLYYWAKMYTANLQVGDSYTKLRKTIMIIILDGEMPKFKEIEKAHTKWHIREDENQAILLTSYLELHIIEMNKAIREYKTNPQDEVLQWMMFLENPKKEEVAKIMEENKDIKEAKEELDAISRDDILRRMALKAELDRMDREQIKEDAEKRGRETGREEGIREGKKAGEKEKTEAMIKRLYEINMPIEQISKVADLDVEKVKKILELE